MVYCNDFLSFSFQYYDVMKFVATPDTVTFLDFAWPGSPPRRVYIRIIDDTATAKQFVVLCTGEQGHSYANTRLVGVVCKGWPGERIVAGDYEYNDGRGGAAIMPGTTDEGIYGETCKPGDVGRWVMDLERTSQFTITTRKSLFPYTDPRIFGRVERGMEVVKAAAKCGSIKKVMLVDCGVVVPH